MLGRQRGSWKLCSQNDFVTSKPTSIPTRSASSKGPIRKPPPMRTTRSMVAWSATLSASSFSASQPERPRAAVGQEARAVARDDHALAHALADLAARAPRPRAADSVPATTSSSSIRARRVEEVHADDAARIGGRRGERGHRQGGGVGREHRLGLAHARTARANSVALQLQSLGRRLDHEVAIGEVLDAVDARAARWSGQLGVAGASSGRARTPFSRPARIDSSPRSSASATDRAGTVS